MNKNKLFRFLLIAVAIIVLAAFSIVAAATALVGDISGDGKVTVFDAQMLAEYEAGNRALTDDQIAASGELTIWNIMQTVWGGSLSCVDTDGDGVYEIYTAKGLTYAAQYPERNYILMNDIDLQGADWTPIAGYTGSFDGNGKTISNFTITQGVPGYNSSGGKAINMGFFGDTIYGAQIKDLHLRDATVTAAEEALYISLLVGSNRCDVTGCTATGTIFDNRETHSAATYIGVMAGRICKAAADQTGCMVGGTSLSVTDDAGIATTDGLCAKAAIVIANSENVKGRGLVGWSPEDAVVSGTWADISNDSSLLSADIQARQKKIVDYMVTMGTAPWTPSEDLIYTPEEGGGKTYYAGTTYYGLPYNRNYGSYERFLSALNEDGTTKEGLGSCIWNETDGYHGFVQLMGNHCSGAVGWAWMRSSPIIVDLPANHSNPYHGGVYVLATKQMVPNDTNRVNYGIYPVGNWSNFSMIDPETGKTTDVPYDATKAAYSCTTEVYTSEVLATNGAATLMEAYAQASTADAIVMFRTSNQGHARLLSADPIVIRNADDSIDATKSYMITTEQGAATGSTSTWRVHYRYSFKNLLDEDGSLGLAGTSDTYVPITMRALHDEQLRASYVTKYSGDNAVTGPTKGKVYSNYRIVSTTVTVKDGDTVIYNQEIFTGVSSQTALTNDKFQTVNLSVHSESFAAAAADLADGTYTFSVQVLLSDGKIVNVVTDQEFTYTA